jgi:hypothetical protein
MADSAIHTVPRNTGWAVVREGQEQAISLHPRKAEAERAGRDVARRGHLRHVIHKRDGAVQEIHTYPPQRSLRV